MKLYKWYKCIDGYGWPCFDNKEELYTSKTRINYKDSFFVLDFEEITDSVDPRKIVKILFQNKVKYIYFSFTLHTNDMIEL